MLVPNNSILFKRSDKSGFTEQGGAIKIFYAFEHLIYPNHSK